MMQVKNSAVLYFTLLPSYAIYSSYIWSGSRTAWIPFVVTIPFMFLINKRLSISPHPWRELAVAGMLLLLEPKADAAGNDFSDFAKRSNIWETAIKGYTGNIHS